TYFNAWPEEERGYNKLPDMAARARVFDAALSAMARLKPDLIVIACNTLSAIYPRTEFSRRPGPAVVDIIEFGVDMIGGELAARPESRVVIFGTPTTIESGIYKARLMARGVAEERIISQACDGLAGEIERNPGGAKVRALVERYVREAAAKIGSGGSPVLAALCCTHYGYSLGIFQEQLERHFRGPVILLDPNRGMSAGLLADCRRHAWPEVRLDCRVVSRIAIGGEKIAAIAKLIEGLSPETATALRKYKHDPELFTWTDEPGEER
ncbi:MAG: aspartate/glutamate racemase family protein, partial [Acidobacteriota bacterium]